MKFEIFGALALALASTTLADNTTQTTISRDVVIIGGGSSGVYTGIKLQDAGKSVIVVEPKSTIGGHAETYVDPETGLAINMGVQVFHNDSTTTEWFQRWNVSMTTSTENGARNRPFHSLTTPADNGVVNTSYVDFTTGKVNVGFAPPSNEDFGAALATYAGIVSQYPSVQDGFNLTYPVADDLLLPLGEFLTKHNISALAYNAYLFAQGYTPLLNMTSLYIFKNFGLPLIQDLSSASLLTTVSHNTHELYDNILAAHPELFLLNTAVTSVTRTNQTGQINVKVKDNTGKCTTITAKKLVRAAPPTLSNLQSAGLDLTATEESLFAQLQGSAYYTGILRAAGLPNNTVLSNTSPNNTFNIAGPGLYQVTRIAGTDLTSVYYGTPDTSLTDDEVKTSILGALSRWKEQNDGAYIEWEKPNWAEFHNHAPYNMQVSPDAIRAGFYRKLYALQGQQGTFWNGAAWDTQDSGELWKLTDKWILPLIMASF